MTDVNAVASQDAAGVEAYYDKWAVEGYNDDLAAFQYQAPSVAAPLLKKHTSSTDCLLLDVGCGTGLSGEALAKEGFGRVVGTDISQVSLDVATKTGHYQSTKRHNLEDLPLPFETGSFDGLFCVGVLTYVRHYKTLLQDFSRVVKKGGILVFTERTDHYADFGFDKAMAALVEEGTLEILHQSDPMPYLPMHKDYAEKVLLLYFVCRVL